MTPEPTRDRDGRVGARDALFVVWGPPSHGPRSSAFARELAIPIRFVAPTERRGALVAPLKYVAASAMTWRLLRRERPRVVFVQSPPTPAVMVCALYAALHRGDVVVDAHSDAMQAAHWTRPRWLYRMLARRSRATIVTNERFARRIRSGGARAIVVRDVPTTFPPGTGRQVAGTDFPVAVVSSGAPDEPLVAIAAAAERVPGATFFVTGDVRRVRERLGGDPPPNVRLTGFLPEADYYGLLRSAVAVVCLTTRDDTMQRGACEALSVGTPIVTSDRPLLREYFRLGTVHVSNTAESIADGVAEIMRDSGRYRSEIRRLARQRRAEWLDTLADLRDETGLPHASGGDRLRRSSRSPSASRA